MIPIASYGMLPLLLLAIFVTAPVATQTIRIIKANAAEDDLHIVPWLGAHERRIDRTDSGTLLAPGPGF